MSKCFTKTLPMGTFQIPCALKPRVCPLGIAIQRVFEALSDQSGVFTSYGTIPAKGVRLVVFENAPSCERLVGNAAKLFVFGGSAPPKNGAIGPRVVGAQLVVAAGATAMQKKKPAKPRKEGRDFISRIN